ncbi:hypothetical protein C8046_00150 [Serinibacter arcticus]|uniref:VOC domain-containing protein n=1 Tax=Serinibacter arcticus TaxID=1655435 RepID=A0A2U1ZQZ7_9MICO|nr:VOC family protein [Serinibacter arcticus]PWD49370.1 hypothetical protein C8046_00150 [Serinibacter arcticus]
MISLGRVVVLVGDLDEALDFYSGGLGFPVLLDARISEDFRALHVGTGTVGDPGIWLLDSTGDRVGSQTGTDPTLVLYSDDLDDDLLHLDRRFGVRPFHGPDGEPGARFAHLRDPWGTEIVIAEKP